MMRIGCSLETFGALTLDESLARIHAAGFSAVELAWEQYEPAARRAESLGLDIVSVRMQDIETCAGTLEQLEERGITHAVVTGGPRRQSLDAVMEALNALAARAADHFVTILVSNARDTRVEQLEDLRYILPAASHPNLRVAIDVGECQGSVVNPVHAIGEFGDLADIVRVSDRVGRRRTAFGRGEVNIPTVIDTLGRDEYSGWVIAEPAEDCLDEQSLTGTRIYLYHASTLLG